MVSLPDWIVEVLGEAGLPLLDREVAGEDVRRDARYILDERERGYSGGDRPPSPPARLMRAIMYLDRSLSETP